MGKFKRVHDVQPEHKIGPFAKMATDRICFVFVCAHRPSPTCMLYECAYHNFVVYLHILAACSTTMEIHFHEHERCCFSGNAASKVTPGLGAQKLCDALGRCPRHSRSCWGSP